MATSYHVRDKTALTSSALRQRTLTELDDKLRDCAAAGGAGLRLLVAFLEALDQCLHAASNGVAVMPTVFSKVGGGRLGVMCGYWKSVCCVLARRV